MGAHARTYIALLDDITVRGLARSFARDGIPLVICRSGRDFMAMMKNDSVTLVLDPALIADTDAEELLNRVRRDRLPTTLYIQMTRASVTRGFAFLRAAPTGMVVENPDRSVGPLAEAVLASNQCSYAAKLLEMLAPALAEMPALLSRAIERLLSEAAAVSLATLARRGAMSPRSLDRWLHRVGIQSPRLLLAVPRFLRALTLARETELSTRRIAYLCGYSSPRRLRIHTRDVTGMTWAELHGAANAEGAITAIGDRLLHTSRAAVAHSSAPGTCRPVYARLPQISTRPARQTSVR